MSEGELSFLPRLVHALEREGIGFALIGAFALIARNASRSTFDVDFLTTQTSSLRVAWDEHFPDVAIDVRRGDHDDPLAGVIRFAPADDLSYDLVVGKWTWQQEVVQRAERLIVSGVELPVATAADLCIMKVDAGGAKDLNDAALLLERHPTIAEILPNLTALPRGLREELDRFLETYHRPRVTDASQLK